MTDEVADRINSAACRAWLFKHGFRGELSFQDIAMINSVTAAQIQTATDFIDAADRAKTFENGKRTFRCTIEAGSAGQIKRYVASLPTGSP
jgi:hypothetical protein